MRILGIETSCDETAVSLIDASGDFEHDFRFSVLGNALRSQIEEHTKYGGVVPNLARHEHERALVPVLTKCLSEANLPMRGPTSESKRSDLREIGNVLTRETELRPLAEQFLTTCSRPDIDAIAVTVGPGLEPCLWVGINFAKALSRAWSTPIVPVNHMEGHIVISALSRRDKNLELKIQNSKDIRFPMLSLLISGAHTELILSPEWMHYEYLGRTRDDAVGEAFDKVARLLGLPYPGGPEISRLAAKARSTLTTSEIVNLPRPMIRSGDYDFSFAGLKTAVRRIVEAHQPLTDEMKMAIAREFEDSVSEVLVTKTRQTVKEYDIQTLVVGGGVSANTNIRSHFTARCEAARVQLLMPPPQFSTDNAVMIALAGYFRKENGERGASNIVGANGSLKLA